MQIDLELFKDILLDDNHKEYTHYKPLYTYLPTFKRRVVESLSRGLEWASNKAGSTTYVICEKLTPEKKLRSYAMFADLMGSRERLDNVEMCVNDVLDNNVPGDFIETGVWRGGICIFMRAMLKERGITDRTVWVADSFDGLPEYDGRYKEDAGDLSPTRDELAVSIDEVFNNFRKYNLLDEQVVFINGWFKDTLSTPEITKLAILRLDGDMYASTMDALEALYPKLSVGGYVIVDDWSLPNCRKAVSDYVRKNNVRGEFGFVQKTMNGITKDEMAYWKKIAP